MPPLHLHGAPFHVGLMMIFLIEAANRTRRCRASCIGIFLGFVYFVQRSGGVERQLQIERTRKRLFAPLSTTRNGSLSPLLTGVRGTRNFYQFRRGPARPSPIYLRACGYRKAMRQPWLHDKVLLLYGIEESKKTEFCAKHLITGVDDVLKDMKGLTCRRDSKQRQS